MRRLGVRTYKSDGVEISLADDAPADKTPMTQKTQHQLADDAKQIKERHLKTLFAASSQRPTLLPRV